MFNIKKRGEIKEGYYADLTVIDMNLNFKITNDWIASRCGWTPFNNKTVIVIIIDIAIAMLKEY